MDNTVIRIRGMVQGVGFRPFVYNLAVRHGLRGWCLNDSEGVVIEVEGTDVAPFIDDLRDLAPPLSRIESISAERVAGRGGFTGFAIKDSVHDEGGPVLVSPDAAVCADCARELFDKADRRYLYPFINCTNCGPRYSIVLGVPYDRPMTTMAQFRMCAECEREYHDPSDRRFHAQPDACPACGPKVWLHARPEAGVNFDAIKEAQRLLKGGCILAVKGLGGFHLACDAGNPEAVARLRAKKRRSAGGGQATNKPFALMTPDVASALLFCEATCHEAAALLGRAGPIVLLEKKKGQKAVDGAVAPGNRRFGVMLAYTPLHQLLFHQSGRLKALVMTSGNLADEPIVTSNDEAIAKLSDVADFFLLHDRSIYMRVDDSILSVQRDKKRLVRRSRGFVPDAIALDEPYGEVFAAGALLKNTFCITQGRHAILSQHIGDLENLEAMEFFKETLANLEKTFRARPSIIAHDMHPDYMSTAFALEYAKDRAIARERVVAVQHHHAHIAGAMAEHALRGEVIGIAFDGAGLGTDGNIWGGEFIVASRGAFKRGAHLRYARLPGGDRAVLEPWRMAVSHLMTSTGVDGLRGFRERVGPRAAIVEEMAARGLNSPLTSSVGRLFDAAASIMGLRDEISFEAEAAIELEGIADRDEPGRYPFALAGTDPVEIDAAPLIAALVGDVNSGATKEVMAGRFHNSLARIVVEVSARLRETTGISTVVLSGGVFQNAVLSALSRKGLEAAGFIVYANEKVPSNDGGISLGQAVIAWETLKGER